MKTIKSRFRFITIPLAFGVSIAIAAFPTFLVYMFWAWCMAQITTSGGAAEFVGILKVIATIVIVIGCGGPLLFATFLFGIGALALLSTWLEKI